MKKLFNPLNKTFNFQLTENTCFRCKTNKCPLENMSTDDILNIDICNETIRRNEPLYCLDMAKKLLTNTLNATIPVKISHYKGCNHYSFEDGQHRTCTIAHLKQNGIYCDLQVYLYERKGFCRYCSHKPYEDGFLMTFSEKQ